ncbi:MAG: biotin transporter BioY [Chloroflexota bacterium]|nr:MAG: biotin transporter BioY [Chloroflexota bacterium]
MLASERLLRVPSFERGLTLGDFLVPIRVGERLSSRARHAVLIVIGTLLIVVGARLSFYLPGDPLVPVTLQTFGVLFGGALLGFRRGILSVLLYLLLGFVGLPVFAYDASANVYRSGLDAVVALSGSHLVLGTTGGYLVGFVLAAALVGKLAELGWDRRVVGSVAALFVGNAAIYGVGLPWLAAAAHLSLADTVRLGLLPFVPGDALKLLVAAGLLPAGWWLVSRRPSDR